MVRTVSVFKEWEYIPLETGCQIVGYDGEDEAVTIPGEINGLPVISLKRRIFEEGIREISVPGSVKMLETEVFSYMSLEKLNLHEGTEVLQEGFTQLSNIKELDIPDTVTEIGDASKLDFIPRFHNNPVYHTDGYGLFRYAVLVGVLPNDPRESYSIPEGTIKLGKSAFGNATCLKQIAIPASLEEIEPGALIATGYAMRDQGIRDFAVQGQRFRYDGKALWQKDMLIRWTGSEKKITLDSVSCIRGYAFYRCAAEKVFLPEEVQVENNAFYDALSLQEVHFGERIILLPIYQAFMKDALLLGFGKNGKQFDYAVMDKKLRVGFVNAERARLMCMRLIQPVELPVDCAGAYRSLIQKNLPAVVKELGEKGDLDTLKRLVNLDFINSENQNSCLELLSDAEITAALIVYLEKNTEAFDFSL